VTITYANIAIDRPALTVPVGTTVVWANAETTALPHNVTSGSVEGTTPHPDGAYASAPLLNPGEKFEHTFTAPGTYHYYCSVHLAQMQGTITVG
jgi:plastocyanin